MTGLDARYVVEVVGGVSEVEASRWDELVGEASPFLEHGFLSLLEELGCMGERAGWHPMVLVARREGDETGMLWGALPLYGKTNSEGEFVFDWAWAEAAYRAGISYYPKAVVGVPFTPVTGRRVLLHPELEVGARRALGQALVDSAVEVCRAQGLSSVHFNFILEEEVELFESRGLPIRYGMQYHWYNGLEQGRGEPYADFEAFLGRFRSKRRASIRRERRLLEGAGVTTRVVMGDAIDEALMARMFEYYRSTVTKFYYGRQYLTRECFLALGERMRHRLHLVIASKGGRDFAGALNMVKGDRLYGRYWGCDQELEFAHFEVCMYAPITWCIEHGIRVFEPGAGGEHKYERGFEPTVTYSAHHLMDGRLASGVRAFLEQERVARVAQIEELRAVNPFKD